MPLYKRFTKLTQTKLVDGMIDLLSTNQSIPTAYSTVNSDIFFVGGFRTSYDNIINCKECNFINIDKGYIQPTNTITHYWRMSYNKFQQDKIIDVPSDRLQNIDLKPWNKKGSYIIILAPNPDPLNYYKNCIVEDWIIDIKTQLLKLTDRKIFVRYKDNKKIRSHDPLVKYLNDCYAIISLQSMGVVQSTIHGIPCINLAPSALDGLHKMKIENIENLVYPDNRYNWLKSLSYSQFTWKEMESGFALNTVEQYQIGL